MRETVRSLKGYFGVVGLSGGLSNITRFLIAISEGNILNIFFSILGVGLAVAFLYCSISLQKLLSESPQIVTTVIWINLALVIASFLLNLLGGAPLTPQVVVVVFVLLISWYLLKSAKRLSQELKSQGRP